jgi:hypothetical protein
MNFFFTKERVAGCQVQQAQLEALHVCHSISDRFGLMSVVHTCAVCVPVLCDILHRKDRGVAHVPRNNRDLPVRN